MIPADLELAGHLSPDMDGYWEGVADGALRRQRCLACSAEQWPPRPVCTRCHGFDLEWVDLPNTGELYSFTITRIPTGGGYGKEGPFVSGIVQVSPDVRLLGHIDVPESEHDRLHIGAPVVATFVDVANGQLPQWRLAGG